MIEETLVVIPARGGSKGIPYKNIKLLGGKPLIQYSIDLARSMFSDKQICVSTDDKKIIEVVESIGLVVPFVRPEIFASDTATTTDVILHALDFYAKIGTPYKYTLILQPTSPFRTRKDLENCFRTAAERKNFEMVISVQETEANPYHVLFEENEYGVLKKCMDAKHSRRQDCPPVWQVNGAFYLINNEAFRSKKSLAALEKIKFTMDQLHSIDIDTPMDWLYAEFLLEKNLLK